MKLAAFRIFVSGTYTDLQQERQATLEILTRLEFIPVSMPFPAAPGNGIAIKREESLRELEKADAMILIVGSRYGQPDLPGDPRSITEVEFDWALEHQIPCYVFIHEPWASQETDPTLIAQHEKFKAKIDSEKIRASFKSPDDLKSQIQLALREHPPAERVAGKPFHRWDQFFREELADGAPPHLQLKHPLLCRTKEMASLEEFAKADDKKICAVIAGQGLGKSRLLLEFAQKAPQDTSVLFLNALAFDSDLFDKATIESLPKAKGAIIVFDDAHDVRNLLVAILQIVEARPLAKILIAGRPAPDFQNTLNLLRENHKTLQMTCLDIPPLAEGTDLAAYVAAQFPGHGNPNDTAKRLHNGSGGVSWVFHFAVMFWKEKGALPTGLISRDATFRDFVLNKILGDRQNTVSGLMLQWLAVIAPAARDRKDWGETFQKLLATNDESLGAALDLWCQERLLRTKGRTVRFVSEIVRDFFILQLAHTPALRDKLFEHFWSPLLKNVLRNLSIGAALDRFDDSGQPSKVTPVFDAVWDRFRATLFAESSFGQQEILKWLEPVAWYQPGHVRDVLAHLEQNPSQTPIPKEAQLFDYKWSHRDVLEKFPPLLKAISHHREYFEWATDRLWSLASMDTREMNPHPEHPMRALEDIAKYRPGKPLWLTDQLVDQAAKWIRNTGGKDFQQSPVKLILGGALAREAEVSRLQGFTFSWGAMPVPADLVLGIQNKALDLLFEILQDQGQSFSARFVIDAIDVLHDFSSGPHRLSLATFSPDDETAWTARAADTLRRILALVQTKGLIPIVRFQLWQDLDWLAERGKEPLQSLAREIRTKLEGWEEGSLEFRLYQCSRRDIHEDEEVWNKRRAEVAKQMLQVHSTMDGLMEFLRQVAGIISKFGIARVDPFAILMEASQIAPERTIELANAIVLQNQKTLYHFLPDLIGPSLSRPDLQAGAREFVRRHLLQPPLAEQGAETYKRFLPGDLCDEDYAILEGLASLPTAQSSPQLRFCLLLALWYAIRRGGADKTRLKTLLLRIDLQDSHQLTDELFMILTGKEVLPTLTTAERTAAVEKLKRLPKLDQAYHAEVFLAAIAKQEPHALISLFRERLVLTQTKAIERAFPYVGFESVYAALRGAPDYQAILCAVRDMAIDLSGVQLWEVQQLFGELAGVYDERVRAVLIEWIDSGDPKKVDIAISFINEAPISFVLGQVDFIDTLFRRLINMPGDQTSRRKHLRGSLFGSAIQGSESRTPGTPSGKYSRLKETASEIAKNPKSKYCQDTVDFYKSLAQDAASTLEDERLRDEEAFEE